MEPKSPLEVQASSTTFDNSSRPLVVGSPLNACKWFQWFSYLKVCKIST
jgi:hypothetical protein